MSRRLAGSLSVLAGAALFGLIPPFVRLGDGATADVLVLGRAFFGALSIGLLGAISRAVRWPSAREAWHLTLWSMVLLLAIGLYFLAIQHTHVAIASVLLFTQSIWAGLLSVWLLGERFEWPALAFGGVSLLGVMLISVEHFDTSSTSALGLAAGTVAGVFAGLNYVLPKKWFPASSELHLVFWQNAIQVPILALIVAPSGLELGPQEWISMVCLGVVCTGAAFVLIYRGSRHVSGQALGSLLTVEVLIPVICGFLVYGETITWPVAVGGALILFAHSRSISWEARRSQALEQDR